MKHRHFELAKKLSKKSDHPKFQMGCVIVSKNRIVGVGFNQMKTHTKSTHAFKTLHAEISALIGNTYEDLRNCSIYVYRETKDGKPAMAKPCPTCELALREAGIKNVYYSIDNEQGFDYFKLR